MSRFINDYGPKSAPVWVLVDKPFEADAIKGHLFSCPMGYVFHRMMKDAGLNDYHIISQCPDLDDFNSSRNLISDLQAYKPPIIIPLDVVAGALHSELVPKWRKKDYNPLVDSEIEKYAGSIMVSDRLNFSHYSIPTFHPNRLVRDWKERDIVTSIDLGKAREELKYWMLHGSLNPLEERTLDINFESDSDFERLIFLLESWMNERFISNDIETIYPKPPTKTLTSELYKLHPGVPITIGLAPSPFYGISFKLFRDSKSQTTKLWRTLSRLMWEVPSIGQNFFNFDTWYYEMLGFRLDLSRCRDTMIRHATLWPELPHKLQFLARQYTRMQFWKEEGQGWTMKDFSKMQRYNALDVVGTFDIYNQQGIEFSERPWLL